MVISLPTDATLLLLLHLDVFIVLAQKKAGRLLLNVNNLFLRLRW